MLDLHHVALSSVTSRRFRRRTETALTAKEREQQRQQDAEDDRGRQWKVEGEIATSNIEVAGEPAERHAEHDEQPEGGDDEADQDEGSAHRSRSLKHEGRHGHER